MTLAGYLQNPPGSRPAGFDFDVSAARRSICFSAPRSQHLLQRASIAVFASARLDIDAGNAKFHAGPSLTIPVLFAVVPLAVDPLVTHLVAVALIEAARSADVLAANFTAHPGDWFGDPQLVGRAAQAGRSRRGPGIGLTQ
jgi:hypothetical protein